MSVNTPLLADNESLVAESPTRENESLISTSGRNAEDIFKFANQSVDELLKEIKSQSCNNLVKVPTHPNSSPLTEPLKLDARQSKFEERNDDSSDYDGDAENENSFRTSLIRSDSLDNRRRQFSGPRKLETSPMKTPRIQKNVTIEQSPPKVLEYEVASDDTSLEESPELGEVKIVEVNWDKVPLRIAGDSEIVGRPLPKLQPSDSNFSIKSMPNLPPRNSKLFSSPSEKKANHSDDSEETIALSPMSQANYSTDYSKAADELVEQNRKLSVSEKLTALTLSPATKWTYDHETYMEDLRRGELQDSEDIQYNKQYRDAFKEGLTLSKDEKAAEDQIIEDLGELYETNINNTDGNNLTVSRKSSVKSQMSINSAERVLQTKIVNEPVTVTNPATENELQVTKTRANTTNNELQSSDTQHEHTRSSSLSDTMGNLLKSMSFTMKQSFSGQQLSELPRRFVPKERQVSIQSTATSTYNDSDFISAEEGDSSFEERGEFEQSTKLEDLSPDSDVTIDHVEDTINEEDVTAEPNKSISMDEEPSHGSSSFASEKFVLQVTNFDDDPYAFGSELVGGDGSFDSSTSQNSARNKGKRVLSAETSPKEEVLAIWSTQETFKKLNHKVTPSFQSICDPSTTKYVVKEAHHKSVNVVSPKPSASSFHPDKYAVQRPFAETSGCDSVVVREKPTQAELTFNNPLNESTMDNSIAGAPSSSFASNKEVFSRNVSSVQAEVSVEKEPENVSLQPEIPSMEPASEHPSFENSIHLSDVLKDDKEDDSFLNELQKWEIEQQEEDDELPLTNTNKETLANVWRRGTLSSKRTMMSKQENDNIKFPHLSVDEVEKFMIHKRMASDEFQIKNASNHAKLEESTDHQEQKGLMLKVNVFNDNDSRSVFTNNEDKIVPELSISTGIAKLKSKTSFPIFEDTTSSTVEIQHTEVENTSRYGDLVPPVRREVVKKDPSNLSPLRVADPRRINSQSTRRAKEEKPVVEEARSTPIAAVDSTPELVNGERGRCFLRLVGLRGLNIPDVVSRNAKFQVVLDNSIHRLTTNYFDLNSAGFTPIGKEFEMIVAEGLDIFVTLKLKYDKPKDSLMQVTEKRKVKSNNLVARCFGVKDVITSTKYVTKPAAKDPLEDLIARDGSFAKFHISFEEFEDSIKGKARTFALDGFNEWKRYRESSTGEIKLARPYQVCTMDATMLFVPRTSVYETLPISIKNAYNQVSLVKQALNVSHEGYMYQEGGDVEVWTRRYFKLNGYDLVAHNETTKKTRAKLNLRRVVGVEYIGQPEEEEQTSLGNGDSSEQQISEIRQLKSPATIAGSGNRGSRVFSDSLLLNDAFRLRFANGETVYFGCDSKDEKMEWVELLEDIVMKNAFRKQPWVKLMVEQMGNSTAMV